MDKCRDLLHDGPWEDELRPTLQVQHVMHMLHLHEIRAQAAALAYRSDLSTTQIQDQRLEVSKACSMRHMWLQTCRVIEIFRDGTAARQHVTEESGSRTLRSLLLLPPVRVLSARGTSSSRTGGTADLLITSFNGRREGRGRKLPPCTFASLDVPRYHLLVH